MNNGVRSRFEKIDLPEPNYFFSYKCSEQKLLLPSGLELMSEFRVRRVIIEQRCAAN